ncbi:cbb3-type cytochrome c oxidase N-terminal domain-containing protein [Croceitalea rosinachiae]|uniref:Cbb3-type cytochrome c oxidase N-terminal domain-containing protein n=1 Tax=Croceitalea rosinachiae TaxID=3075596 RepID=A0ABU3A789_9FLAO|nr:cbb3-type cytochrome c oxidase N-terminal domain-containing protein [Croceitalea sp. F388]MDT0605763.1 cbb3-type cytochrome c oxidase N-terminal domain-containing protein [Croceitalea sp. F388]
MFTRTPWWIRIPVLFFLVFGLMEYFIDSGEQPAFIAYPITQFFLLMVLLILIAIEVILKAIENVMFQTLSSEAQERYLADKNKKWEWKWGKAMYAKLTRTKKIEEEGEIILDHNYDGIRELDNVLPPWWVYMFYATIIFGVIYLVRFHIVGDYTQAVEYDQEVAAAKIEIEEYKKTAKNLVDVNTVELLTDASDLNAGKTIFTTSCVVCHMADGGGGIGPNLTDENWILGGGIKNVFNTISEGGRDGKGMVAWKQSLKPLEMAQVASYLLQFQGTTPANPKAPEGDVWIDPDAPEVEIQEEAPAEQVSDSTTVVMN